MSFDAFFLFSQLIDDNAFEIILFLNHFVEAEQVLALDYFFFMKDHLVLKDNIEMPMMGEHLIDLSFNIGVLFDPRHLHVSDHLLVVNLLEMDLFEVVVLQVVLKLVELVAVVSEGLCQLLNFIQVSQ